MRGRISTRGQVTVPIGVRRALGLGPGMPVEFMVREGEAVMRMGREGTHPVDVVYGKLKLPRSVFFRSKWRRSPGDSGASTALAPVRRVHAWLPIW